MQGDRGGAMVVPPRLDTLQVQRGLASVVRRGRQTAPPAPSMGQAKGGDMRYENCPVCGGTTAIDPIMGTPLICDPCSGKMHRVAAAMAAGSGPTHPVTHDVTRCDDCPLLAKDFGWHYCSARQRRHKYRPDKYGGTVVLDPDWCPLRERPLLVRLVTEEE